MKLPDFLFDEKEVPVDSVFTNNDTSKELCMAIKGCLATLSDYSGGSYVKRSDVDKAFKDIEKYLNKLEKICSFRSLSERTHALNETIKHLKEDIKDIYAKKLSEEISYSTIYDYYNSKIENVKTWFAKNFLFEVRPEYRVNSMDVALDVVCFGGKVDYRRAFKDYGGGWHGGCESKLDFDKRMEEFDLKFSDDYLLLANKENVNKFEEIVKRHIGGITHFEYTITRQKNDVFVVRDIKLEINNIDELIVSNNGDLETSKEFNCISLNNVVDYTKY